MKKPISVPAIVAGVFAGPFVSFLIAYPITFILSSQVPALKGQEDWVVLPCCLFGLFLGVWAGLTGFKLTSAKTVQYFARGSVIGLACNVLLSCTLSNSRHDFGIFFFCFGAPMGLLFGGLLGMILAPKTDANPVTHEESEATREEETP